MNRNYAERKLTLDFEPSFVKEKINQIINADKSTFRNSACDDLLGTYRYVARAIGMQGGIVEITVNSQGENKTELLITCKNTPGSHAVDSTLGTLIDNFLKLLSPALKGETITAEVVKQAKGGGCLVLIVFAIGGVLLKLFI